MTSPRDRHLSWERFEQLVQAGPPAIEVVAGQPRVEFFTDVGGARIGIRTPLTTDNFPPSPLVEIEMKRRFVGDAPVLEISTTNSALYRDFYAFGCAIADRLQLDGMQLVRAIDSSMEAWGALLQRLALLDDERQVGLLGELWVLRRLSAVLGWEGGIEAWKGGDAEEHDFSWASADVEVKTTISERRIHLIGSLTQLVPTASRPLFVLSIQLTSAGAGPGESLSVVVRKVEDIARATSETAESGLRDRLHRAGWREKHAPYYTRRYMLRTPPCLIPVDAGCPAITPGTLVSLGEDRLARLRQVIYRVDLTGLGHEDGSEEFEGLLPRGGLS